MADNRKAGFWIAVLLSVVLYIFIGYFIPREATVQSIASYGLLFIVYTYIVKQFHPGALKEYVFIALFFRLCLLMAFPALSDDIYRFVWDGRILVAGFNPFEHIPRDVVGTIKGLDYALFEKLNSKEYYSVYPPVAQFIFWLSVVVSPQSIWGSAVVIRLLIILAEAGSMMLLLNLARYYRIPTKNVFWYALNPLVILELTGNLHFEAFTIFFILLALALLVRGKYLYTAGGFALAIGAKLLPAIFLPLLVRRLGLKKWLLFGIVLCFTVIILFTPLISIQFITGMGSSLGLYFQSFEFNASIYYLVREVGFWFTENNIIQGAGPVLGIVALALILVYTWKEGQWKKSIFEGMLWIGLIFLAFSTTIHPWYITPLLAFGTLTRYRWPVAWSLLIFLTYAGYSTDGFKENYGVIFAEYLLLAGFIMWETIYLNKKTWVKNKK